MSVTDNIIRLHGAANVADLIKKTPLNTKWIAVSRNKLAAIAYKMHGGRLCANYMDSEVSEWQPIRDRDLKNLEDRLKVNSFLFTEIEELRTVLNTLPEEKSVITGVSKIVQSVNAAREKIALRRESSTMSAEYWQGQEDALDAVLLIARELSE